MGVGIGRTGTMTAGALAFVLGFAAQALAAEPPVPAVSVTFPEGWRVAERDGFLSARHPSDRARCNRDIVRSPPLDGMSAGELEAEITRPWDAAAWAGLMGAPVDKLIVVATEAAPAGPRQVRTGTLLIRAGATPVTRKDVHARIAVQLLRRRAWPFGERRDGGPIFLRKIVQHLRTQNWTAVGIDLLIVARHPGPADLRHRRQGRGGAGDDRSEDRQALSRFRAGRIRGGAACRSRFPYRRRPR